MKTRKLLVSLLAVLLCVSMMPISALAAAGDYDATVSNDYFKEISKEVYELAPGITEVEMVLNNADGNDRKVVHTFEVDTTNEMIEVLPGYYGIDKLDPDNLPLEGIADKSQYWKAMELTKTVAYYESLGYNVVGAMNTALAYDSNAPYGYMVWNGVVLGTPEVHKGAQTYLAINKDGSCELRSMSTPLTGNEQTAISANFGWLVKDGVLQSKTVERTSSDASRSMIGIKADGTLVFCQVDGRNAPTSSGLSNYEMGEMMLALGCVNAVNCDGGGSSTFVSKRPGDVDNIMRSVPSDGSERPTINSVILVSKVKATGEFDKAVLNADYDYMAPGATLQFTATGVDAANAPAAIPEGATWKVADASFGTIEAGKFVSSGKKGVAKIQLVYNDEVVGETDVTVVDPDVFAFTQDETVLPYGKSMTLDFACTYGVDDWAVCVDGAYTLTLSNNAAATLNGNTLTATSDESIAGVDVTATYKANTAVTDVLKVTYGKGSEIIYDFEDGDTAGFMGFTDAKEWSQQNGVNNTLVGSAPLDGQFNEQIDSTTFISSDIVRNGKYALAWSQDFTDATFANWSYNILFNVGETIVLRDVANGKNATTLGMWLYIPEGATGLSFQSQLYTKNTDGTYSCKQDHFTFITVSGTRKNLNSCTEADIPESRWVYASIDISGYDYLCTPVATDESHSRSPSFIRSYVKPSAAAVHTFYIDDITLDYSSAVDDRVLPSISNVSYTTADESVALNQGATITGNTIAFSATISDNVKLDYTTGKISVDGVALSNVTSSGKVLASENVTLNSGVHTVAFEIKDAMGNPYKVTRTFTVAGDAVITLGGHNDSGKPAEYDSVYYVDIKVADMNAINKLTAQLKLQDANTWEPQGMVIANGFKASYSIDKVESILTVTVERNGAAIDASATTLLSIPVRLWSWDGVNNVTGEAITPEAQFATGYCPIVTVDCQVLTGAVELMGDNYKNTLGAFGGTISVVTNLNDNVNPWHYHDAELTTLPDVAATCYTAGYTGRTYCETCQSVVDWGTIIPATGHTYEVQADNTVACACGATLTGSGLVMTDNGIFYLIADKTATGWQAVGTEWCYADPTTKKVATGTFTVKGLTYTADDTGVVIKGAWVNDNGKLKYSFGPDYYAVGWHTIQDEQYFFGIKTDGGYAYTGIRSIVVNPNNVKAGRDWYEFADDGKLIRKIEETRLISEAGATYYIVNGATQLTGLTKVGNDYYYFSTTNGKMATNVTRLVAGNCIDASAEDRFNGDGTYTFGADGKMVIEEIEEPEKKNGIIGGYYYVDDVIQKTGLTKVGNDYYYFSTTNGKMAANVTRLVAGNCIDASAKDRFNGDGTYTFGADGKMILE